MSDFSSFRAAIAAHRFGLGEASLDAVDGSPAEWLAAQIGPADAPRGEGLPSTSQALAFIAAERDERRAARIPPPGTTSEEAAAKAVAGRYREVIAADARSRLRTAMLSTRPFAERLHLFWTNHFTVSVAKGSTRGLVGAFERDAIRPHIAGSFEALLTASTTHPAMLRYLDNTRSAGPRSQIVERAARRAARSDEPARLTGLNENLAREVLELHTLGADSARGPNPAYTQADVTEFARVLTGWRAGDQSADGVDTFDPLWHEPGTKTLLGKTYPEGRQALQMVLHDLALHPATARFVGTKLARHFIADDPPPALIERLAAAYRRSDGQLAPVYRELIASPESWNPRPAKLKTPEEFVVSSMRMLGLNGTAFGTGDGAGAAQGAGAIGALGQRIHAAPSPAGWSDQADDWLGPDAIWKRIEWSTRAASRLGSSVDARLLAERSLGPRLTADTRLQLERAADGPQALALLLMSPEFQMR